MLAVRELIRQPIWAQLLAPWRPTLSAIVMALAVMSMDGLLTNVNDHFHLILALLWVACVGAVVYAGSVLMLWRLAGCPDGFESSVMGFLVNYSRKVLRHDHQA